ncbi:hypothetical protein [Arthrobacter sp. A2-55]|uniref:hypothetical protein n=1 Tax=Arthrobacter sp. A2-55 TaxID=2897337 RepID=UPI0021CD4FA0|nr:hypothetical protein [Arthrobacter sp. A2-55]MCU6481924.1 hypothetical protein [Arthrobacter sp. A2-55]
MRGSTVTRRDIVITDLATGPDGTESWTETLKDPSGIRIRKVTAEAWDFTRTNCYCCTCDDYGSHDPYCRNHGWAGQRPCEEHGMPGQEVEEFDGSPGEGDMPDSVQVHRAKKAATAKAYETNHPARPSAKEAAL